MSSPGCNEIPKACSLPDIPDWLEAYRIQDEQFELAYAKAGSKARSKLKTAIAATAKFLPPFHAQSGMLINDGQWHSFASRPVGHAAILLPADYDASARVSAASVVPLLAGVQEILAFCLGGNASSEALAAFELCALEEVFCVPIEENERILQFLVSIEEDGAVACLYGTDPAIVDRLRASCSRFFYESYIPRIVADPGLDQDLLRFLHGSAPFVANKLEQPDALITLQPDTHRLEKGLTMGPGMEGLWLFPGFSPAFFSVSAQCFGLCQNDS